MEQQKKDFDTWMAQLLEESITEADFARLQQLLKESPKFQTKYQELLELHAVLLWDQNDAIDPAAKIELEKVTTRKQAESERGRFVLFALAIATAVIFLWGAFGYWPKKKEPFHSPIVSRQVNCVWSDQAGEVQTVSKKSLLEGDDNYLKEGIAELEFPAGEVLTVYAPAVFRMEGSDRCHFESGKYLFRSKGKSTLQFSTPAVGSVSPSNHLSINVTGEKKKTSMLVVEGTSKVRLDGETKERVVSEEHLAVVSADGNFQVQEIKDKYLQVPRSLPEMSKVLRKHMVSKRPKFGWQGSDGAWSNSDQWAGKKVPGKNASVRVSRMAKVTVDQESEAGEVFVGAAKIVIRSSGRLKVSGLSGNLDVGFRPADNAIILDSGVLDVQNQLVLRESADLIIKGGQATIGADLFFLDGQSQLVLDGDRTTRLIVSNLFGMSRSDRMRVSGRVDQLPQTIVNEVVQVGGKLDLNLKSSEIPPDLILLIENRGAHPIQGRFQNYPEGALIEIGRFQYRLTYQHGEGRAEKNDLALVRIPKP